MIKITSLNKIYTSKKRKDCQALSDVNLTLPDTGLVFVLGKSGSGKSTLLNLIGGLDSITSGKIEVDGNDLSNFREKDFCYYRNTHVGFIFQDYHLIEELTVSENIMLSLDLRRIEDADNVKKALEKVDLAGYEDRYPGELSGGEQQRVAIARAIVKKPRIILADEPTGNLDTNTAKAIVELLKSISKECLIIVVSHNPGDANAYADRIIELKGGKIIADRSKNPDFADEVVYDDGKLMYPSGRQLSDQDIALINDNKSAVLVKRTDKFVPTSDTKIEGQDVKVQTENLSFAKELKLSGKFLKNKALAIVLSSFMVAVIMIIMALAQTIIAFNAGDIIVGEMDQRNQQTLLMYKVLDSKTQANFDYSYRLEIDQNDVQAYYDAGYNGKVYPVVNVTAAMSECRNVMGFATNRFGRSLYMKEALGTLVVDEEFLTKKFGKIEYIAKLDEPDPYGLIITDYIADCVLAGNRNYFKSSYEEMLGEYFPAGWNYSYIKVNAIIRTGYKETHKALFQKIGKGDFDVNDFYLDEDYIAFSNALYDSLGYAFSTNPDFYQNAHLSRCFYSSNKLVINDIIEFVDNSSPLIALIDDSDYSFKGKSLTMNYNEYNKLFDTDYGYNTDDFVPHTIKLTSYRFYDIDNENPLYSATVTIDGLHAQSDTFLVRRGDLPELEQKIGKSDTYYTGLYFDGTEGIEAVFSEADRLRYEPQSYAIEGIRTMTKAVEVFVPIFKLIAIFLCVGVVFILMSFSSKMINGKMHDIGIMKALGTRNTTVAVVFGLQIALIALLTCILATTGYFLFIDVANTVLIESLKQLAPGRIVLDLNFLTFKSIIAIENCILIVALAVVSLLAPMIKIKSIKPVKIIKAKE